MGGSLGNGLRGLHGNGASSGVIGSEGVRCGGERLGYEGWSRDGMVGMVSGVVVAVVVAVGPVRSRLRFGGGK